MAERRRTTLSDVAARAGVSVTTASYVLNGRTAEMRISTAAGDRVHAAAAELNYRPNRNARNLRSASTATIGVITDYVAGGAFASRMLTGAAAEARSRNHLLVIGESEGDPQIEALLIEEMLDRQVDGVVYATLTTSRVTPPRALPARGVVLANCLDVDDRVPGVVPDELEGGRTAVRALLDAGHGQGIYVVGEDPTPGAIAGSLRLQGVLSHLEETGSSLTGVVPCPWAVTPAYQALSALLAGGVVPEALICLNDRIAMGAYEALRERGLRVGQDVSVVSFDGSELAGWLRPAVCAVEVPYAELGAAAVAVLMGDSPSRLIPMSMVDGDSIRSLPGRRTAVPSA